MPRLVAVSMKPYRTYRLELQDAGGTNCSVVIHPPGGRGAPHEVVGEGVTLGELINRAKAMVDAVLGPRPPMAARSAPRRDW